MGLIAQFNRADTPDAIRWINRNGDTNMQVSQLYLDGIKEGRKTLQIMAEDGPVTFARLQAQLDGTVKFRGILAQAAYSVGAIDYVDGEIDFIKGQLRKLT